MSADLLTLATSIAGAAGPHEAIEAYVVRSSDTEIEVFDRDVESLSVAGVEGVGVRVVAAGRQGYAWAGSLDPVVVETTVADARDNASFGTLDEDYGVASPDDAGVPVTLDLWRDALVHTPTDEKVRVALDVEAATMGADDRIRGVETCKYRDRAVEIAIANSRGVQSEVRRTSCSAHAVALAGSGDETQTGYGFSAGRDLEDLDLDVIARDAARRSTRMLGARQVPSRRLPVVLDPIVTSSFLSLLTAAFSGESLLKGRSLFEGRLADEVAATSVSIVEDPTDTRALGAAPADSEGVATRPVRLVTDGVLRAFLHDTYTGRRSGDGSTGSATRGFKSTPGVGVRGLRFEPGQLGADAIVAAAGEGLYVQSVSGLHSGTNPVSGAFSVGAEGLVIRGGELAEPVREVTIASTLQRMLGDVTEIGADLVFMPGSAAGQTVLISEMTMSGT